MKTFDQNSIEDAILNTWLAFTNKMENTFSPPNSNKIHFIHENQVRIHSILFNVEEAPPELFELLSNYYHLENTVSVANKQKILENTFKKISTQTITFEREQILENKNIRNQLIEYYKYQEDHIKNTHKPDADINRRIDKLETLELYSVSANSYAVNLLTTLIENSIVHCQNLELAMRNQIPSLEVKVQKNTEIETPEHSETRAGIKRILDKRYQPPIESTVSSKGPTYG